MATIARRTIARPRISVSPATAQRSVPPRRDFRSIGLLPSVWQWIPRPWRRTRPSILSLPRLAQFDAKMSDAEFYALPAMEQIRYAMNRPVPTVAPELADQRLLRVLTGPPVGRLLPEQSEEDFRIAYHPERLEWLGDRVCYGVAGEVLFALAPLEEKSQSKPELRSLGFEYVSFARQIKCTLCHDSHPVLYDRVDRLVTNDMHGKLSREFKLSERIACFSRHKGPADAWEAYLAALLISNGRRALLEFYAPLLRREYLMIQFLDRFDRLPPVVTTSTRSLQSSSSPSPAAAKVAPPTFTKSYAKRDNASSAGGAATAVAAPKGAASPSKPSSTPSVKTTSRPSAPSVLEQIQTAQDFVPTPKKLSKLKPNKGKFPDSPSLSFTPTDYCG